MSELKIDRAFVTDVARGGRDGALAVAVITLGSELGLQVVAEGVETKEQSEFLIGRGCALQQGYLFSRPVPQAAFEQMLKTGTTRPSRPWRRESARQAGHGSTSTWSSSPPA